VWQKSHSLTLRVYAATATFPKSEMFGLTSQMRRASVSIPANIAEGASRGSRKEFARYLNVAVGSAGELEYDLLLASELALLDRARHAALDEQVTDVKRMLAGLIRTLRADVTARITDNGIADRPEDSTYESL
jgi:four helix bundle protein